MECRLNSEKRVKRAVFRNATPLATYSRTLYEKMRIEIFHQISMRISMGNLKLNGVAAFEEGQSRSGEQERQAGYGKGKHA